MIVDAISIGLHPWDAQWDQQAPNWHELATLLENENVYFLGETGLDYIKKENLSQQELAFHKQIELSQKIKKPILIHCVRALSEILSEKTSRKIEGPWVLHDFNGNSQEIQAAMKHGCYISLGKNMMRDNTKVVKALMAIKRDRLFFETDENDYSIEEVYQRYCELSGIGEKGLLELCEQVENNFKTLFALKSLPFY
ncbi:hydrolase, TatD family [Bacteriovorax sp. BSW11_IV]|uniref:TatD family hydrolase n=1 Tax=Bacteriovorax sp. BSW11_IV TaxID=1353529 RepID=UPI00038A4F9F|nr:TatD family hydrolase [Bacteriovorax sp. BSW11_IV]EQC46422.1 hydrolase, TatD family [Bacteriovorax sp. BSW11_IV]